MKAIYLDHQATTPVDPEVLQCMLPYFTQVYGNAASKDHQFGLEAKQAVERARAQIAEVINANPNEIVFTSGATESNNLALVGVAEKYAAKGDHIITCVTEHKAILDTVAQLEKRGKRITRLPVDQYGLVDPNAVRQAITPRTVLISIMTANNEIGTLAPIAEIGNIAATYGVLFHTDAVQAFGRIPLDVKQMNIHLMSLSAHKIYGPKGVGALYRRASNPYVQLEPILFGGGHERNLRSGTLNVPGIVGFGEAARLSYEKMESENSTYRDWTQYLYDYLSAEIGEIHLNGHPTQRLAHNLNISLPGVQSRALIVRLKDVAIATGSACTSDKVEPSHVITALGFGLSRAHQAIRISVGRTNNIMQIQNAALFIRNAISSLTKGHFVTAP